MTTCVHCVLARLCRSTVGAAITVSPFDAVRVPHPARAVYRSLHALVQAAAAEGDAARVHLRVVDLVGRSTVDVLVTARRGRRATVRRLALVRHAAGTLEAGFVEGEWAGATVVP